MPLARRAGGCGKVLYRRLHLGQPIALSSVHLLVIYMHPRIAVVTGANKGIGYEIAKQLLTTCTVVVLACRNKELGEAAVKQLASPKARFMQCDISDAASIAAFADTFSAEVGALDVLVNNAAIAFKGADPTPFEGQTGPTLRTNYKGTVALTERMLPLLEKSANGNLVNIASMAGRLGQVSAERQEQFTSQTLTTEELTALADEFAADVAAGRHKANGWGNSNCVVRRPSRYAIDATSLAARPRADGFSKLCVIAYTKLLARRYAGTALNVNCCCPGYCRTDMASNRGPRPPEVGARNAVMLAEPTCALNGEFIQDERVSEW